MGLFWNKISINMKIYRPIHLVKTASMTFHVDGFPYQEFPRTETLLDLAGSAIYTFHKRLLEFMGEEERKTFWKYDMTLTPDGESVFESNGIMNLYLGNSKPENVQKIINLAIEVLNEFAGVKAEFVRSDDIENGVPRVARIHVVTEGVGSNQMPPEINLSNSNAFFIFQKVLKYQQDLWKDGSFDAQELKKRIQYYLGEESFPITDVSQQEEYGKKIQDGFSGNQPENFSDMLAGRDGMSSYDNDDVRNRLQQILNFCEWTIKNGYSSIYVS